MRLTISQFLEVIELLPDGTILPHGATHTINLADPHGRIPRSFYTGETYMTFIWSSGNHEWSFDVSGNTNADNI